MKNRIYITLLVIIINIVSVNAQQNNPISITGYPYKSPEATSFKRYGEYNVGTYTGNPQISIPLYTVKYRDIEIPKKTR